MPIRFNAIICLATVRGLLSALALAWLVCPTPIVWGEVRFYNIDPGGEYSYLPSPWVGIPDCGNSGYSCDFGIDGGFALDFDRTAGTAKFIYASFELQGNEAVQSNPPTFAPVTPTRVDSWLQVRLFQFEAVTAMPADLYQAELLPGLELLDLLNGKVELSGGYNSTFVDGDGIDFSFSATEFTPLAGDFNLDGTLDGADFLKWQQGDPIPNSLGNLTDWLNHFGNQPCDLLAIDPVPEPTTLLLAIWLTAIASGLSDRKLIRTS